MFKFKNLEIIFLYKIKNFLQIITKVTIYNKWLLILRKKIFKIYLKIL